MQASKAWGRSGGGRCRAGMRGRDAPAAAACTARPRGRGASPAPWVPGMGPPGCRRGCTLTSASEEPSLGSPKRQPCPIVSAWAFHRIIDSARRTPGVAAGFTPADRLLGAPSLLGLLAEDRHPPLRGEVTEGPEPGLKAPGRSQCLWAGSRRLTTL